MFWGNMDDYQHYNLEQLGVHYITHVGSFLSHDILLNPV